MIKKLLLFLLFVLSAPAWGATNYFMSPTGSDSANGLTTGTAWLTANHAVNCGDVITASTGAYSGWNFWEGSWGTVTGTGHCVATVKCATAFACTIDTSQNGTTGSVWVDKSHWMVTGFYITSNVAAANYVSCMLVSPNTTTLATIHDVVYANNILSGCQNGGMVTVNQGVNIGVDYVAFIGNIIYNASQSSNGCTSGISIYQPVATDTLPGTHFYIAGNFSYGNFDPATCAGTPSTDGEGIIIDTPDFSQGGGTPYVQQIVIDNNIVTGNGSVGLEVFNNQAGSTHAPIIFRYNTSYGNMKDTNENKLGAGEFSINTAVNITSFRNITQAAVATALGGNPVFGYSVANNVGTASSTNDWIAGVSGNNTFTFNNTPTFNFGGSDVIGTSAALFSPTVPSAPTSSTCSGFATTTACFASVIANFKPTNSSAMAYGYQTPGTGQVVDALYPQWLCSVTSLPSGLVTPSCAASAGGSYVSGGMFLSTGITIQ